MEFFEGKMVANFFHFVDDVTLLNGYFLSTYMPGTVLGPGVTVA